MLSVRRRGWSLLGRLFCSVRHCKVQAYVTVFSLGISQMSRQAKVDMMGGMNLCQWRHVVAGGAWNGASLGSSPCICLGSRNEALISRASLPVSSCRTVDNSGHQSGDITTSQPSIAPIQQTCIRMALGAFPHLCPLAFWMILAKRKLLPP